MIMMDRWKKFVRETKTPFSWRRILLVVGLIGGASALLFLALIVHAAYYQERVLPGLQVGTVPVGGMTRGELTSFLQSIGDRLIGKRKGQREGAPAGNAGRTSCRGVPLGRAAITEDTV